MIAGIYSVNLEQECINKMQGGIKVGSHRPIDIEAGFEIKVLREFQILSCPLNVFSGFGHLPSGCSMATRSMSTRIT